MMNKFFFFLSLLTLLIYSGEASSNNKEQSLMLIFKDVFQTELTASKHEQFWSTFIAHSESLEQAKIESEQLQDLILTIQIYQYELWRSIRLSYTHQDILLSKNYLDARKKLSNIHNIFSKHSLGSKEFIGEKEIHEAKMKVGFDTADLLLKAASLRENFISSEGISIELDLALIDKVISDIDNKVGRILNLLDPNWHKNS
jgi:hypothetical protein